MRLSSRTQLTAGLTTGYFKTISASSRTLFDFRLSLDQNFGPKNRAALTYSYSAHPSAAQPSLFTSPRQMVGLSSGLHIKGCVVRASASQEIGGPRRYGSLSLSQPLPFGTDRESRPLWSLQLGHFFSQVDQFSAAHTRLALSRTLGRYRASLCYSPQGVGEMESRPWVSASGFGYSYTGGRHFWLELSAAID